MALRFVLLLWGRVACYSYFIQKFVLCQDVKYPLSLDVYDLCSPELQKKLVPMRSKFKEFEEKKLAEAQVSGN